MVKRMMKNIVSNLKNKIKVKLLRHKVLYLFFYVLKNHNNSKFNDKIFYPEKFLQITSYGNKNSDKNIYMIDASSEYMGFGAYFRWCLEALYEADRLGFVPVVKFGELCPYNENEGFELGTNSFEYYFKPVSKISVQETYESKNVFLFNQTDLIRVEKELGIYNKDSNVICGYSFDENYIKKMGEVVKKYIEINQNTKVYIDKSIDKLFESTNKNVNKILAVHIRGTDFILNWDRHPNMVRPTDYFPIIDEAIKEHKFNYLFLATDDSNLLTLFKNRYSDKLLYFKDVNRSNGQVNVAYVKNDRKNNNYLNGLEVVRDIYTMAYCDGLIAGLSQVSICVRIINRSLDKNFECEQIINKGIYQV